MFGPEHLHLFFFISAEPFGWKFDYMAFLTELFEYVVLEDLWSLVQLYRLGCMRADHLAGVTWLEVASWPVRWVAQNTWGGT